MPNDIADLAAAAAAIAVYSLLATQLIMYISVEDMSAAELRRAVVAQDSATLESVPGIGKRSAQKLILELRPRMELPDGELPTDGSGTLAEVRSALEGLGYQSSEVREAMKDLPRDGKVEDLLREALQLLGSQS